MILNSAKNKTKSAKLGSKNGPHKNLAPPSADSTLGGQISNAASEGCHSIAQLIIHVGLADFHG